MGRHNGSTSSHSTAASSHSRANGARAGPSAGGELSTVINIPIHILRAGQQRLWGNKLLLAFEAELNSRQARDWIDAYNQEANVKFSLHDELQNALFVVKFEADNDEAAKKSLIRKSPLKANDIFATVNDYYRGFDASNPFASAEFKHLVTVYIKSGDPETFEYLKFVVKPVGKLVRGKLAPGVAAHRISAFVVTNKRILPPDSSVWLESGIVTTPFDYTGRNLRCLHCFSYRHFESRCNLRGVYGIRPDDASVQAPRTIPRPLHTQPQSSRQQHHRRGHLNNSHHNSALETPRNNQHTTNAPTTGVSAPRPQQHTESGGAAPDIFAPAEPQRGTESTDTNARESSRCTATPAPTLPPPQNRRLDHDAFDKYQDSVHRRQAGTEYWQARAEEQHQREEAEIQFEAARATAFETEQAEQDVHRVEGGGEVPGGLSDVIPTIPIATTQRSSSYSNPRRPPKKTWRQCSQEDTHTVAANIGSPANTSMAFPRPIVVVDISPSPRPAEVNIHATPQDSSNITIRKRHRRDDSSETESDPQVASTPAHQSTSTKERGSAIGVPSTSHYCRNHDEPLQLHNIQCQRDVVPDTETPSS
ncbi:unnamed protein product [Calypogeia fissa]